MAQALTPQDLPLERLFGETFAVQFNPETASLAKCRADAGFATHSFCPFLHNRETDASTWKNLDGVQSLENPEYAFVILRFDADAIVLYVDADALSS